MPQYLITLSIGPVQDFIAAARKTRDLWLGSNVLSEVSKAAALSFFKADNNSLIFPTPEKPEIDLQKESPFNVGNKILVLVNADNSNTAIKTLENAKLAAKSRWVEIAEKAKNKAKQRGISIDNAIWDHQVNDVLELYGAWIEYDEKDNYKAQRELLDKLLNARKNTREFIQNPVPDNQADHCPKSSLDGLRENLIEIKNDNEKTRRKAGLRKGEYLDCTGVVKRLGEDPEQFTPLSRIGIDPWLRGMSDKDVLTDIRQLLKQLVSEGLVSEVKGNEKIYGDLKYDGQLLYPFRLNTEINDSSNKDIKSLLKALQKEIKDKKLYQKYGEPLPYVAILQADGDRMGKLLNKMGTINEHREVSKKLSEFAKSVPDIVRENFGHCIYAGGDDVLALVPLDQAIACSYNLAKKFKEKMQEIKKLPEPIPTLSVGIGISHIMTPMGKQLDLARKAESLAKGNELEDKQRKDSLAIILQPRSGATISFREKWQYDDEKREFSADRILCKWIEAHLSNEVPRQVGYNLREESVALDWGESEDENSSQLSHLNDLREWETRRILGKKQIETDTEEDWVETICQRVKDKGMREAANELIMTYRIAKAFEQAASTCDKTQENKANV